MDASTWIALGSLAVSLVSVAASFLARRDAAQLRTATEKTDLYRKMELMVQDRFEAREAEKKWRLDSLNHDETIKAPLFSMAEQAAMNWDAARVGGEEFAGKAQEAFNGHRHWLDAADTFRRAWMAAGQPKSLQTGSTLHDLSETVDKAAYDAFEHEVRLHDAITWELVYK